MPELGQEQVSGAAGSAAEACTRRGAARPGAAAKVPPAACKRWRLGAGAAALQARPGAGARGAARQLLRPGQLCAWVWTCVGCSAARPSVTHKLPPPPQLRVQRQPAAVFVQLRNSRAAPVHPGAAPAGKPSPSARLGGGGGGSGARLLLLRLSETWCLQGPASVTDLRPGRRGEELAKCRNLVREASSPSPSSVHGKVDMGTARAGSLGTEVQGWQETGRVLI